MVMLEGVSQILTLHTRGVLEKVTPCTQGLRMTPSASLRVYGKVILRILHVQFSNSSVIDNESILGPGPYGFIIRTTTRPYFVFLITFVAMCYSNSCATCGPRQNRAERCSIFSIAW